MSEGYCKGDLCNRNGCIGVINEHERESPCSCHISPPCGSCTTAREFCPVCEWDAREEQVEMENASRPTEEEYKKRQEQWAKQQKDESAKRELFWNKYHGKLPVDKVEIRYESHTHFSMKKHAIFPPGTNISELMPQLHGTFGGRMERQGPQSLTYIAYTD